MTKFDWHSAPPAKVNEMVDALHNKKGIQTWGIMYGLADQVEGDLENLDMLDLRPAAPNTSTASTSAGTGTAPSAQNSARCSGSRVCSRCSSTGSTATASYSKPTSRD